MKYWVRLRGREKRKWRVRKVVCSASVMRWVRRRIAALRAARVLMAFWMNISG